MKLRGMGLSSLLAALGLLWAPGALAQDPPEEAADEEAPLPKPPAAEDDEEKKDDPTAPPPPAQPPGPAGQPAPAGGVGFGFGASTAPQADTGAGGPGAGPDSKPKPLVWRGTSLGWDNSATTHTVGLQEQQSRNPTYEMSFAFQPRYYLWETEEANQSISLRARIDLVREFTNSDTTTREGEWTLTDLSLFPQYGRNLYNDGLVSTDLGIRLPTLAFPTSKVSANNGRIFAAGAQVFVAQGFPLAGEDSSAFKRAGVTARVGYNHWFTEATQPTSSDLQRVRMGPDGRSLPGDQLGGAAFANHQANFDLLADLSIIDRVSFGMTFSWRPSWKYTFENREVCNNVVTGCVTPQTVDSPNNFSVITLFGSEVSVDVLDELSVAAGYANLTLQVGPDGTRRNIFGSPDSRVYLTVTAKLDEIYTTASGNRQSQSAAAPPVRTVAQR